MAPRGSHAPHIPQWREKGFLSHALFSAGPVVTRRARARPARDVVNLVGSPVTAERKANGPQSTVRDVRVVGCLLGIQRELQAIPLNRPVADAGE